MCTYNADVGVNGGSLELTGLLDQLSQPAPDSVTDLESTAGFHMHMHTYAFTPTYMYTQIMCPQTNTQILPHGHTHILMVGVDVLHDSVITASS